MPRRPLPGEWFACLANDFDGADDAPGILTVNLLKRLGVVLGQFAHQVREWNLFQLGTKEGIGRRRVTQAFQKCFEVKARPAAQEWHATAHLDVGYGVMGPAGKLRGIERLGHIDHINQVMANALAFDWSRLGSADVQAAIDLHGIDRNDFAGDLFRDPQGDFALAGGGGACQEQRLQVER